MLFATQKLFAFIPLKANNVMIPSCFHLIPPCRKLLSPAKRSVRCKIQILQRASGKTPASRCHADAFRAKMPASPPQPMPEKFRRCCNAAAPPKNNLYFAANSAKRISSAAAWAREAAEPGLRCSPSPCIRPAPQAHCMAGMAYSLTENASA